MESETDSAPRSSKSKSKLTKRFGVALGTALLVAVVLLIIFVFIDTINGQKWRKRRRLRLADYHPRTGDLLLFSGRSWKRGPTMSCVIKLATNSDLSHVGIVWVSPLDGQAWLWHTGPVDVEHCPSTRPLREGVARYAHIARLDEVIAAERGRLFVRQLVSGAGAIDPYAMAGFISRHLGLDYAFDVALHWYHQTLGILPISFISSQEPDRGCWSCAELVAATLQHLGIIDRSRVAADFLPHWLSQAGDRMSLRNGYAYSEEFLLER
jgi:hypothetical protein